MSPGSKENKPEGEPVKKRRRIIQLDSDDSGDDETFNPTTKVTNIYLICCYRGGWGVINPKKEQGTKINNIYMTCSDINFKILFLFLRD